MRILYYVIGPVSTRCACKYQTLYKHRYYINTYITRKFVSVINYNITCVCYYHFQCNRGRSLDVFFDEVQSEPTKIALLGCGCSVATEPVAEISHQWNISQVFIYTGSEILSIPAWYR